MKLDEAWEWLAGERSSWNTHAGHPDGHVTAAREDAAHTEQAYWIVRAHREGFFGGGDDD